MSLKEKLLTLGAQNVSVESQLIGFYYAFGTFSTAQWEEASDALILDCAKIQGALSKRFENQLRALPEWTVEEHGTVIEPYEMCANDNEAEEVDGRPAFSMWIYHGGETPIATIKAFRQALQTAIEEIADVSHGQVRIEPLKVVTDTIHQLGHREEIDLDD